MRTDDGASTLVAAIGSLDPRTFERFVIDILKSTDGYTDVQGPVRLGGREVDAIANSVADPILGQQKL